LTGGGAASACTNTIKGWPCIAVSQGSAQKVLIQFNIVEVYSKVLSGIVGIIWYHKSILMIWILSVISWFLIVLVLDHQYQVSDWIISESICLKYSRCQSFDA